MKTKDITWLREFLAAERGVSPPEISASEAISSHRKRQLWLWTGFLIIVSGYLCLRVLYDPIAGRIFVALVTAVSLGLCVREVASPSPLNPGGKLAIRKELSAILSVKAEQVPGEYVEQHDRRDWRNLVCGLFALAAVGLAFDWIWPKSALNPPLELVLLLAFYFVGRATWRRRRRRTE